MICFASTMTAQTRSRFFYQDAAKDAAAPVRRHYATTEEKIQQEFREMQQREEELRYHPVYRT